MRFNSVIVLLEYIISYILHPGGLLPKWYQDSMMSKVEMPLVLWANIISCLIFHVSLFSAMEDLSVLFLTLSRGKFTILSLNIIELI